MLFTDTEIAVRHRVHNEARKPPQAHFADEDTVTFTREEISALWDSILKAGSEIARLRETISNVRKALDPPNG